MRQLISILGVIGLVGVVFILVLRGLAGGHEPNDYKSLTTYKNSDTVMQYVTTGPVVSEQERSAVRITVGRSEDKIEILKGYNENVVATKTYPSNTEAYGTFLRALDLLGYNRGSDSASLKDERGYCPEGNLYRYEIKNGQSQIQRFWKTSCGQGNFGGKVSGVDDLFIAQIPDYDEFTQDVSL